MRYDVRVETRLTGAPKIALWEWPNVLSLDAPLVAALWQSLFARVFGAALGWPNALLLYAAVWLIYSADRWLDGRALGEGARTRRHLFYAQHSRALFWYWLGVGAATLVAGLLLLTWAQLLGGSLLGGLMLGYLFRRHRGDRKTQPKELQIAVIFALGVVFLPLSSGVGNFLLALCGGLFGMLIFLNCTLIAQWEGELDEETAPFTVRAPWLAARLGPLTLGFALFCGVGVGIASGLSEPALFEPVLFGPALFEPVRPLLAALTFSALLLYGLGRLSPRLSPAARRVLADAALFTPLLWLLAN